MPPNVATTVYDIRVSEQAWSAVGGKVKRKPRTGIVPHNEPKEWLSLVLHITNNVNPAEIPIEGLSLYQGQACIGKERAWFVVRRTRAEGITMLKLSTQPSARPKQTDL